MHPDSTGSNPQNKPKVRLSSVDIGWKNLMNECLMRTEVFEKNESKNERFLFVDPNSAMDWRHKMVKHSANVISMPQVLIHTEALKLLRIENHDRLLRQKEGKMVEKEISKFKQVLENHRLFTRKKIDETAKKNLKSLSNIKKFSKIMTQQKKLDLEGLDKMYKLNSWQRQCVPMIMEPKISHCVVSHVKLASKNKREHLMKEKYSESVSLLKGGVNDEYKPEYNECSWQEVKGKSKISKVFFKYEKIQVNHNLKCDVKEEKKVRKNSDIHNFINRKKMEHTWEAWKSYTKKIKSREREKTIFNNKIEIFFMKLKEKDIRGKDLKELRCIMNLKQEIRANSTPKNETKKMKEQINVEKKEERIKKLMQEIKTSQMEASHKLREISKCRAGNQGKFPEEKFFKRMEGRREERLKRRKEIQEKKRKKDEEREKAEREKKEEKRWQEEKYKQEKLKEFNEKQRLEKKRKEERDIQKEVINQKIRLSKNHYERYLLCRYGLKPWRALVKIRDLQNQIALTFHAGKLKQKIFLKWAIKAREQVAVRAMYAEAFYKKVLKRRYFLIWIQFHKEIIKQNQVAVDWNEFKITERAFKKWLHFTHEELMNYLKKEETARLIHERKLKLKCLKKLTCYQEFKKLQQVKENQKRKWRQKVREILPDYRPVDISEKA